MTGGISFIRQSFFSGTPTFTAKSLPDLSGKVVIVTGSNTGVGKEIAQILYGQNAKVYMMARSKDKTTKAINDIKSAYPSSQGELTYIRLDLSDLTSIQESARAFLQKESRLDVLFNNAGVGYPDPGSKTKQGYELQLGVNCLGSWALTQQLTPTLVSTAKTEPKNTVRVVWASSSAAEATPANKFIDNVETIEQKGIVTGYFVSKLGNYFHATEYAARHRSDGIISIPLNPGNLDSDFWRTQGTVMSWILRKLVLYPAVYGAYTNLFAGFSPSITLEHSGRFVAPWGRLWDVSHAMVQGSKSKEEGGTGIARWFWQWTEKQVNQHVKN